MTKDFYQFPQFNGKRGGPYDSRNFENFVRPTK